MGQLIEKKGVRNWRGEADEVELINDTILTDVTLPCYYEYCF